MDNRNFIAKRAAAYFQPGDVVNLGIGIPSLCGSYAVDGVLFQSENGFIGIGPTVQEGLMKNERFVNAGGVPFVPVPGSSAFDVAMSFNVIRCGRLAATVLGGLQVSAQGDLANWATPGRAFGMGGAMDLCNGARKVIVAMELGAKDGSPKVAPVHPCPHRCKVRQPHRHRPLRHRRDGGGAGPLRDPEATPWRRSRPRWSPCSWCPPT
ncbi:MAG: CoA-transferase [Flavonifractor plautii]